MNGERKIPTAMLMASADQLDPTFFRICAFSYFRICSSPFPFSRAQFFKDRPPTQPLFDHFHSFGKPYSRLVAQHPSRFLDAEEYPEQQPQPVISVE
jgi:hypothetical protein